MKDNDFMKFMEDTYKVKFVNMGSAKKKAKPSLKTLKRKAQEIFKKWIRMRDCLKTFGSTGDGDCYTCGKHYKFEDLQAGHFQQGSHGATYFLEDNVHAQCCGCNTFKHGNLVPYTLNMIKEYGQERVDELIRLNHTTKKFKASEYEEIITKYKNLIEKLS
jgi:hypothetical protein